MVNGVKMEPSQCFNADDAWLMLKTEVTVRSNDKHVLVTYTDFFTSCNEIEIHHLRLEMVTQRIVNDEDDENSEDDEANQWFGLKTIGG